MTLLDAKVGKKLRIVEIQGGYGLINRLVSMGLYVGDRIKVVRSSPFHGPLLIENIDQMFCIALGRGMAAKIIVEEEIE